MIVPVVAHDEGTDLGRAYNEVMRRLSDEDWACFMDHDIMWTTRSWFAQLHAAVKARPEAGLFGCMCNRSGNLQQILPGVDQNNHDMVYHRNVGNRLVESFPKDEDPYLNVNGFGSSLVSGMVMLTSKRAWQRVDGFIEGHFFGVDNDYHQRQRQVGNGVFLIRNLYVYHWYRGDGDDEHARRLSGR